MKKITALLANLLITAALFTGCSTDASTGTGTSADLTGVVKTGGSTSVEKVMLALIYQFQENNNGVKIDYEPNGSGDGIKNTQSGLYEIGHSSRELKTDGSEGGLEAIPYAIDGIAIVVHNSNGVKNLTQAQLKDIYTGAVTNWKGVGGHDAAITVLTRESGSGTRDAFAEIIGLEKGGSTIIASASVADNTGAIQTQVAQNPNAIGYMSFSDVDTSKVAAVSYESVTISTVSLKDGTYKLKREFYLLTKTGAVLSPASQAFLDFVQNETGQQLVADNNLLPVKSL